MHGALRAVGLTSALILWSHQLAAAQFVTLLPEPAADSVAKRIDSLRLRFDSLKDSVYKSQAGSCSSKFRDDPRARRRCVTSIHPERIVDSLLRRDTLQARSDYCRKVPLDTLSESFAACVNAVDLERAVRLKTGRRFSEVAYLMPSSRRDLLPLYSKGLRVFSAFTANVSDEEILVMTDVVSGAVGVFPFGITHATVVSKAGREDTLADTVVQRATERVLQLLNNGGTLTARVQYPVLALGGTNIKHSASTYLQAGLLGPLGDRERIKGSVAGVVEYMVGFGIRRPDSSAALVGELILGGRAGFANTLGGPIDPGVNSDRGFRFYQLAFGLQQSGALRLSVLYSHILSRASNRFVPEVVLNFSVPR
ncbi:MAG: hypothetical protein ACREMV_00805 [Gemmatimonadales bacterium]